MKEEDTRDLIQKTLVEKTHPGFTITCQKCESTQVIVDSSVGFSCTSGAWGSVDLKCLDCENDVEIWNPY